MIRLLAVLVALAVTGEPAHAHMPIKGMGSFSNGMFHPVFVPAHMLTLFSLGLLIGQHVQGAGQISWIAFTLALWITLPISQLLGVAVPPIILLLTALTVGLLVALNWWVPASAGSLLGAIAGVGIGTDSMPEGLVRKEAWLALAGTGVGAVAILTFFAGIPSWFQRPWQRIAIRVAGSWTAASAIMVLALTFAGTNPAG